MAEKKIPPTIILTPEQDAQLQGTVQTPAPYNPNPPASSAFPTDWQLDPSYTGPTPINQLPLPSGPINPNLPSISPPPIRSEPLPTINEPNWVGPPQRTELPAISEVKPLPPAPKGGGGIGEAITPQFQETSEGTIITNLAQIKAQNRQINDAVDALAPYKQGSSYNLTDAVINKDTKAEQAALLLFDDFNQADLDKIKTDVREWEALNREYEALQKEADEWMSKKHIPLEEYNKLTPTQQKNYTPLVGITIDAFRDKEAQLKKQGLSEDEISWELKDFSIKQKEVTAGEYAKMSGPDKEYYSPDLSTWEYLTPWSEEKGETVGDIGWVGRAGIVAAEVIVPGVYMARNWGTMPSWEKGLMIGLDVISIVPMVGFGIRGVASGVMKGMTRKAALGQVALAQIKAPFTMIAHPFQTLGTIPKTFKEATRVVYAPWEAVMQSRAGMKSAWSDLRLIVGAGGEVSAETLHAMQQLSRMAVAETTARGIGGTTKTAKGRVGFQAVELDAVAVVKTGKHPAIISSTPHGDQWLTQLDEVGYIDPTKHTNQIFGSTGGTGFVERTSSGEMGNLKVFNYIEVPDGIKEYPEALQKLLHAKGGGAGAFDAEVKRMIRSGELEPGVYGPHDIYRRTAEDELIIISPTGIVERKRIHVNPILTGKKTTFKWIEPDPKLLERSNTLRKQAQEKMQAIMGAEKVGDRLEVRGLRKEFDKLLDEADEVYKQAIKNGTPRSKTVDIDHMKTINPNTGEEYLMLKWSLALDGKPWTLAEKVKGIRVAGWWSIPKNIVKPQLRLPKMTGQQQINLAIKNLTEKESTRFGHGLSFLDKALPSKIPKNISNKWVVDFSAIKSIPNSEMALKIEEFLATHDHRVYGSLVDNTQCRIKGMLVPNIGEARDLDLAFKLKKDRDAFLKLWTDDYGGGKASSWTLVKTEDPIASTTKVIWSKDSRVYWTNSIDAESVVIGKMKGTLRDTNPYFKASNNTIRDRVDIVVTRKSDGAILLVKDKGATSYSLPGGGLSKGESSIQAIKRELYEETGLRVTKVTPIGSSKSPAINHKGYRVETSGSVRLNAKGKQELDSYIWWDKKEPIPVFSHVNEITGVKPKKTPSMSYTKPYSSASDEMLYKVREPVGDWKKLGDIDLLDSHIKKFEKSAFGFTAAEPVTVKSTNGYNITMDSVTEQLRRRGATKMMYPGWGVAEGQMGVEAAAMWGRLKDIPRFEANGRFIIQIERDKASDLIGATRRRLRNREIDDMELNLNKLLGVSDDTTWTFKCRGGS